MNQEFVLFFSTFIVVSYSFSEFFDESTKRVYVIVEIANAATKGAKKVITSAA